MHVDPHDLRTIDEVRSQPATIIHRARADDPYWLTSEWGLVALDSVDNGRDEDGPGDIACVATSFTCH